MFCNATSLIECSIIRVSLNFLFQLIEIEITRKLNFPVGIETCLRA